MTTRPRLLWPFVVAGVLALLAVLAIPAELIARSQLTEAVWKVNSAFPTVRITPAPGLALVQLATGRLNLVVTVPDAEIDRIKACRADSEDSSSDPSITGLAVGITRASGSVADVTGITNTPAGLQISVSVPARIPVWTPAGEAVTELKECLGT